MRGQNWDNRKQATALTPALSRREREKMPRRGAIR